MTRIAQTLAACFVVTVAVGCGAPSTTDDFDSCEPVVDLPGAMLCSFLEYEEATGIDVEPSRVEGALDPAMTALEVDDQAVRPEAVWVPWHEPYQVFPDEWQLLHRPPHGFTALDAGPLEPLERLELDHPVEDSPCPGIALDAQGRSMCLEGVAERSLADVIVFYCLYHLCS